MTVESNIQYHDRSCKNIMELLDSLPPNQINDENSMINVDDNVEKGSLNISRHIQDISNQILNLKSHQRKACLLLEKKMENVRKEKAQVEAGKLMIQNLSYEKDHLTKEIAHCKDYCTNSLDKLVNKILEYPTHTDSNMEVDGDTTVIDNLDCFLDPDQHNSNVEKLNFQIKERARLVTEYNETHSKLALLRKEKSKKEAFIADLLRKVEQIEKATYPIQSYFKTGFTNPLLTVHAAQSSHTNANIPHGSTFHAIANATASVPSKVNTIMNAILSNQRTRFKRAGQLPTPLYTLFYQLEAVMNTFELQKENKTTQNNNNNPMLDMVSIKVDITPSKPFSSSSIEDSQTSFYDTDPSAILLHFYLSDQTNSAKTSDSINTSNMITIRFQYMTCLNIITAVIDEDSKESTSVIPCTSSLINLFPYDTGEDTPNGSNFHLSSTVSGKNFVGLPSFKIMPSRPFLWAQALAGLSFLPKNIESEIDNMKESTENGDERSCKKQKMSHAVEPKTTAAILRQLNNRIWSSNVLAQLLSKLSKLPQNMPIHPMIKTNRFAEIGIFKEQGLGQSNKMSRKRKEGKELVQLKKWKEINVDDTSFNTIKDQFPPEQSYYGSLTSGSTTSTLQHRYFFGILQYSNNNSTSLSLEIFVEISPEYPIRAPRWRIRNPLQSQTKSQQLSSSYTSDTTLLDNNLNAIERRVNVDLVQDLMENDKLNETHAWILVHQLQMIMICWESSQTDNVSRKGRDRRKF